MYVKHPRTQHTPFRSEGVATKSNHPTRLDEISKNQTESTPTEPRSIDPKTENKTNKGAKIVATNNTTVIMVLGLGRPTGCYAV